MERSRWESPVEKAIREAQERGEFDDLPGAGKPLPDLGDPDDPLWWLRRKAEREQLDLSPALPPRPALRGRGPPGARGLQRPGAPRPPASPGPRDAAAARPHRGPRRDG